MNLGKISIFIILRLLNHEHIIYLHFFGSCLISLSNILSFLAYKFFSYVVRHILKYFVILKDGVSRVLPVLFQGAFDFYFIWEKYKDDPLREVHLVLLPSLNISCEYQLETVKNSFEKVQTPLVSGTPRDFTVILTHTWPLKMC